MKTIKNKILGIVILLLGIISIPLTGDGTFFVFMTMICVALIFARKDVVCFGRDEN